MKRLLVTTCVLTMWGAATAQAGTLYGVGDNPDTLYTINVSTGAYNAVGNYTLNNAAGELFLGSLEFAPNGTLYGVSVGMHPLLYTVNPNTAALSPIGLDFGHFLFEGGLAFDPVNGDAYVTNGENADAPVLYRVNLLTGLGIKVGNIGNTPGVQHDMNGLAFDAAGQLYGIDGKNNSLWKIDKTNPSGPGTSQVGAAFGNGIDLGSVGGMTSDPATGTIYAYASASRTLFTINLQTGAASVLFTYPVGSPRITGLAWQVPEPATVTLVVLAGLACLRRRTRR